MTQSMLRMGWNYTRRIDDLIIGFVPSYALQQILALLSSNSPTARSQAYMFSFLTFVANLSFAQLDVFRG